MTDDLPDLGPPVQTMESRQEQRQSAIPALYRTTHERLACELALRMEEPEIIFKQYGFSPDESLALMESPAFTVLLAKVGTEIRENGLDFKMKIKAIAADLLPHAYDIATDPLQSAAVRADIIKWSAKLSGWEPSTKGEVQPGQGNGFTLSITFAGAAPQTIVSGREPILIEQT